MKSNELTIVLTLMLVGCPRADATLELPPAPEPMQPESMQPEPMQSEPRVEVRPPVDDGDDDGRPDELSLVRLNADGKQIELLEPVQWTNAWSGELVRDQAVLDDLAALLSALPESCVEVQGHESAREDLYGMKPTDRQARAVHNWLVNRGIDATRLTWQGWGDSKPLADNATAEGRAMNNRIEVWIVPCRELGI